MIKGHPSVYALVNENNVDHVAECARICYHSTPADNQRLYNRLIRDGHTSMLRHETHYYRIPTRFLGAYWQQYFKNNPFCGYIAPGDSYAYIVVNGQWLHEKKDTVAKRLELANYEVDCKLFLCMPETFALVRYTFCIDTQIGITRELNRVSPNNISERSTRFIDFLRKLGIRFSIPHWYDSANLYRKALTNVLLKVSEWSYMIARSRFGLNLKAEDARGFLNLLTESRVAYTYSVEEWNHIVNIRYHGTTGKPHPDAKNVVRYIHHYIQNERNVLNSKVWTDHSL